MVLIRESLLNSDECLKEIKKFAREEGFKIKNHNVLLPLGKISGTEYGVSLTLASLTSHLYQEYVRPYALTKKGKLKHGDEIECIKVEYVVKTANLGDCVYTHRSKREEMDTPLNQARALILAIKFKDMRTLDRAFLIDVYESIFKLLPQRTAKKLLKDKILETEEWLEKASKTRKKSQDKSRLTDDEKHAITDTFFNMNDYHRAAKKAGVEVGRLTSSEEWEGIEEFAKEQGFRTKRNYILLPFSKFKNIECGICLKPNYYGKTFVEEIIQPYILQKGKLKTGSLIDCFAHEYVIRTIKVEDKDYVIEKTDKKKGGNKLRGLILGFKFKDLGTIDPSFIKESYDLIFELLPKKKARDLIESSVSELEEKLEQAEAVSSMLPKDEFKKVEDNIMREITAYLASAKKAGFKIQGLED